MPLQSALTTEVAPSASEKLWLPPEMRGTKLKPTGSGLVHTFTTDTYVLAESDWVYLQIALVAYQIHPATVAELSALGPVGGPNAKRWTIEGPLVHVPGDPGEETNCTMRIEVATSMTSTPGSAWRDYSPGRFRLRSAKARLTITRPSTAYSFRVARFTLVATRISAQQRSRKVASGVVDAIPSGMCRVVVRDFEIAAGASLEVESGAHMEILN